MKRGDLVCFDGLYHINGGDPEEVDCLVGIVIRQIDCEIFEVLIEDKIMVVDESMLTEVGTWQK